jgi:hypothetical protein
MGHNWIATPGMYHDIRCLEEPKRLLPAAGMPGGVKVSIIMERAMKKGAKNLPPFAF